MTSQLATALEAVREAIPHTAPADVPEAIGQVAMIGALLQQRLHVAPEPQPAGGPIVDPDQLLTIPEAAPLLSMTEVQVAERLRRKEIPAVKLGRFWRIRRGDVALFIARNRVEMRGARR